LSKLVMIGVGLGGLAAATLLATGNRTAQVPAGPPAAQARLATVSVADRSAVDYARLDARLKQLVQRPTMVGLAVGIVENGRITFLSGYGETLAGSGEQVTPETVFRWASVSKGVAATMIAKLAEQGKLSLHGPVARYSATLKLPAGAEHRATVGDLLSHRLGLYRNAYDNKLEEGQSTPLLRQTLAELNLICPPGTCWSYQNVAYDGASEIVETLTGQQFEKALREQLFAPIGMTSASASREGLMSARSWARPHSVGRRPLEVKDAYYRVPAAGGVNSSIKDLALWMIAQMGAMPGVLSPQVLDTIHAPVVKTPGENRRMRRFLERVKEPHYGYGWRSYDYSGHRVIGHHGGVAGYRALIMFDRAKKSGVVAMWNSNTSQPAGIEFEVMDMIYGLPARDWLALESKPGASPAPAIDAEPMTDQGSEQNS
jgi:beta-lactamase class C